ncbi:unnamed protein product [Adineta steineri]|uniref:Uncharacterized protein n=2 Tax=Adineta steineri TaxID=433720 RepID=A0A815S891_9BILA|nr:unnamed protein product [Adineta steineri]
MSTSYFVILFLTIFISTASSNPILNYTQSHRGCGPIGIDITSFLQNEGVGVITPCCIDHDACYSSCNTTRTGCNDSFRTCTKNACAAQKPSTLKCSTYASILYSVTSVFGIPSYDVSQRAANCTGKA